MEKRGVGWLIYFDFAKQGALAGGGGNTLPQYL
jgi:hypothetical protein